MRNSSPVRALHMPSDGSNLSSKISEKLCRSATEQHAIYVHCLPKLSDESRISSEYQRKAIRYATKALGNANHASLTLSPDLSPTCYIHLALLKQHRALFTYSYCSSQGFYSSWNLIQLTKFFSTSLIAHWSER